MSDGYKFELPGSGVILEVDHLRRERSDLIGELVIRGDKEFLPGARLVNGCLSTGNFNFSSPRARQDQAKTLAQRANTNGKLDWFGILEDFTQRVFQAERDDGEPAIDLRTFTRPPIDDQYEVDGMTCPRRHPSIWFGDGGSGKTALALRFVGRLAQQGVRVGFFDWEMDGPSSMVTLEKLFGSDWPLIIYKRFDKPLATVSDVASRIVREHHLDFVLVDSITVACDGPPEAAEVAARYFRAVREIGCGSLHIAHITKSGDNNDQKPFGSTFWHNLARSTWYVHAADATAHSLRLGLFHRKSNLGALRPAVSYLVKFTDEQTAFHRVDIGDSPDFLEKIPVRQRIMRVLRESVRTVADIAEKTNTNIETVRRTINRYQDKDFTKLDGDRIALKESR